MTWSPHQRPPAPSIDIQVQAPQWTSEPLTEATVHAAINAAAAQAPAEGEVSVLLADDAAVRELNRRWRGIDKPTNVLSFPAAKSGALVGDIAIAYETVAREAANEGKPFLDHLAHLCVHGFLHLVGYDHQTDSQADAMEALERAALSQLNIADPYLARETGTV